MQETTRRPEQPVRMSGYWVWPRSGDACEVRFVGKGPQIERHQALSRVTDIAPARLCWPRQIHSAIVHEARGDGVCGDGDAVITRSDSVTLSVVTADCVPIVVEGNGHLGVIHAGWRGLAQEIIAATVARIPGDRGTIQAWIGPAIGACCYEVDWDVAEKVAAVSRPEVIQRRSGRPHLALASAARAQLESTGVASVSSSGVCTMCSPLWLWSYRRDRPADGRNLTFAWRKHGE